MNSPASSIMVLRPGQDAATIFCLPEGKFIEASKAIPKQFSVSGLLLPDLQALDPPPSVEDLAQQLVQSLQAAGHTGPYYFFGYSMGGLVAYEMACLLRSLDKTIALLALFDTPHPGFSNNLSANEMVAARRLYQADRTQKYIAFVRRGRPDLAFMAISGFAAKKLRTIFHRLRLRAAEAFGLPKPKTPVSQRINEIWHSYRPKDYFGRLVLIRAQGRDGEFGGDPSMGWRHSVRGEVAIIMGDGSHENMMDPGYVSESIRKLQPYLTGGQS